jgi:hypothetical protein
MSEERDSSMEYFYTINPCSMCESSTENEGFEINGKRYVLCDTCYNLISYVCSNVVSEILKQHDTSKEKSKKK